VATTEKVSVAIGTRELRLAKAAAEEEGVSLSAFVTGAVRERLAERTRREAAREVLASFAPSDLPTDDEQRDLVALWTRARPNAAAAATGSRRRTRRRSAG
jgi:hypothetical protein